MPKHFDKYQQQVIDIREGCHLVLAPPGCGKTEILRERVAVLRSRGVGPEDIICLTFTNRAAREMRERLLEDGREEGLGDLFVGNLHSFCSRFLSANGIIGPLTGIIDEEDQRDIMEELGLEELNFAARRESDRVKPEDIALVCAVDYQKEHGHPREVFLTRRDIPQSMTSEVGRIAGLYARFKEEHNVLDFNDLLLLTYTVLTTPGYREDLTMNSYHWVQVDEVQDLSPLQMAIVESITAPEDYCVLYLGDDRQAIYSFMGAKMDNIMHLHRKCPGPPLHLYTNYRSPSYMQDLLNTYASTQLGMDPDLLPRSSTRAEAGPDDLAICPFPAYDDMVGELPATVRSLMDKHPGQSIGILVRTNKNAEEISTLLTKEGLEHFKLSGKDIFKSDSYKTLTAHMGVCHRGTDLLGWARILWKMQAFPTYRDARTACSKMRSAALSPLDLMAAGRGEETLLGIFARTYREGELVIFDTETTGLDVFRDDIIQIAAVKVRRGAIVPGSRFNILLGTDRPIPETVGGERNPMLEVYREGNPMPREEGLGMFMQYIGDAPLLGHNSDFDVRILGNNLGRIPALRERYCPLRREVFDSLRLIRLCEPALKEYKLRSLLEALSLEGKNTHRAEDDILATKSLADYIYGKSPALLARGERLLQNARMREGAEALLRNYYPLYLHTREAILCDDPISGGGTPFMEEFKSVYGHMTGGNYITRIPSFDYLCAFLEGSVFNDPVTEEHMLTEVERHLGQMRTFCNADLCGGGIIREKIHLMTVHKAKGLEFDRVVLFNCTDGTYPWFNSRSDEEIDEDKRVLYVGLSRARRGICVLYCHRFRSHPRRLTPFLDPVRSRFRE